MGNTYHQLFLAGRGFTSMLKLNYYQAHSKKVKFSHRRSEELKNCCKYFIYHHVDQEDGGGGPVASILGRNQIVRSIPVWVQAAAYITHDDEEAGMNHHSIVKFPFVLVAGSVPQPSILKTGFVPRLQAGVHLPLTTTVR